jgi:hypothetical protein
LIVFTVCFFVSVDDVEMLIVFTVWFFCFADDVELLIVARHLVHF